MNDTLKLLSPPSIQEMELEIAILELKLRGAVSGVVKETYERQLKFLKGAVGRMRSKGYE